MSASFSLPVRFFGRMRWPDMYCSLCGQRFFFIQSGISETSSRDRTFALSVLAIIQFKIRSFDASDNTYPSRVANAFFLGFLTFVLETSYGARTFMGARKNTVELTPSAVGYRMPGEWEPHQATWLGWPHESSDWPGKMPAIRWVYGEMIRKIAQGEKVRLCVNSPEDAARAREIARAAGANLKNLELLPFPTNRGWMRDSGPIFVRNGRDRKKMIV